mmetsp:Transcript_28193/g.42685  ORF Transcript_28193/g.42685 Transcript_28193/m.42685 type:complete len:114 (+) Transcript_28193:1237-1578(+)
MSSTLDNPKLQQSKLNSIYSSNQHLAHRQYDSSAKKGGKDAQLLNRTSGTNNGSMSSFAYTSNKNVPKYSPARNPKPGSANVPMSYAGPPNQEELARNRDRHLSGNRNFHSNT